MSLIIACAYFDWLEAKETIVRSLLCADGSVLMAECSDMITVTSGFILKF